MNAFPDVLLLQLAELAGVDAHWLDAGAQPQDVPLPTLRAVLTALGLPCENTDDIEASMARLHEERAGLRLPRLLTIDSGDRLAVPVSPRNRRFRFEPEDEAPVDAIYEGELAAGDRMLTVPSLAGYYRLLLGDDTVVVAVAPSAAFGMGDLAPPRRPWGVAVQIASLRRPGDGGFGDFGALEQCVRAAAARGADALAISPVHAMFSAAPERYGPYAPSSRLFLNTLFVDPVSISGEQTLGSVIDTHNLRQELSGLEWSELIDWPRAARARMILQRSLFEWASVNMTESHEFNVFRRRQGDALERHARFEALHAHFRVNGRPGGWQGWPVAFHDPESAEVAAFAREHSRDVAFYAFLQWMAAQGLGAVQKTAREAGMSIGLIADLAVGSDAGGSQAWSHQAEMLRGISVGAPPDALNRLGQDWGLTTFSPRGLLREGYAGFIAMLRVALAHAGGVRIDHVLGLKRLWMVPYGAGATEGAYVRYPMDDLLRLVALESHRHRALVIGEDLGTIPGDFRRRIGDAGVLGIRVLWFERALDRGFIAPELWSAEAIATTSTHDVPTVAGWWSGTDIDWRMRTGLNDPAVDEYAEREQDRVALWRALCASGSASNAEALPAKDDMSPVTIAAAAHVARSPAPLAIIPAEDMLAVAEQPNLPGPTDAVHPNWRRRLPDSAGKLFDGAIASAACAAIVAARARS
ncbi:MAG TPA: 4-alpha-glucanotransferase [Luteibacter sp.]|nr:4-alpha-glucanotransferase [Luteibacter sp.]